MDQIGGLGGIQTNDRGPDNASSHSQRRSRKSKYHLYEDIEEMMFGCGDTWPPQAESVELMEDLVVKYIHQLCQRAQEVADFTGKLDKQCFLYAVRCDQRKFSRAVALLKANSELKSTQTTVIAEEEEKIEIKAEKKPKAKSAKQKAAAEAQEKAEVSGGGEEITQAAAVPVADT